MIQYFLWRSDVNKSKIGRIMMIASGALIAAFAVTFCVLGIMDVEIPTAAVISIGAAMLLICLPVLLIGERMFRNKSQIAANRRKYDNLPYREIENFKAELNAVRDNYAADSSPDKNTVPKLKFTGAEKYFDFDVLNKGKIYYACLVQANNRLFKKTDNAYSVLPAVFVYSTEAYYEENPYALESIAGKIFEDRENNILKNETHYFTNVKVDESLTDGHEVYITTLMVNRAHLPLGYLSNSITLLIAEPLTCSSAFIVDVKYLTENLACHIANRNRYKNIVMGDIEKYSNYPVIEVTDHARELDEVRKNFLVDVDDDISFKDDKIEPFGDLGKENKEHLYEFTYAYIVESDKRSDNPYTDESLFAAVILYSDDEEYKRNPRALKKIADIIGGLDKQQRKENFKEAVDYRKHTLSDVAIPLEWTDGRRVFLSGALIMKGHLPAFHISDRIIPVVRTNGINRMIYSIDKSYWTEALISEFVHGKTEN